ncbi:MAG: PEP-CTERM sorting domain-containing protein [Cyanobacteria bacterium J06643_5]
MLNLKKLSILSISTLIALLGAFGNSSAQAVSLTNQYTTVKKDVVIDFDEKVGVGKNPLKKKGVKLDKLWADYGLEMDSSVKELWLYNSNCKAKNGVSESGFKKKCTGDDQDLATGKGKYGNIEYDSPEQGKVLIIQENEKGGPDDLRGGGKITFNFTDELGVDFNNIGLLDFDDPGVPIFDFTFLDGSTQQFQFGLDADENDPMVTLLSEDWDGNALKGENSLRQYDFELSQNIKQLDITLPGSGAVTYVDYERTVKRKVPEPTSVLGLFLGTAAVATIKRKRSSQKNLK